MKLYIRQKVFSFNDKFDIYNEAGEPLYYCEGEIFSIGSKLRLYDMQDRELFYIKQKVLSFMHAYDIYAQENLCASVQEQLALFRTKLRVESSYGSFDIEGSFWEHDFSIYCNGRLLGTVQKAWMTWGDSYCLQVAQEKDAAFFTALVIAIDNVQQQHNAS
ncbi:MAG: LURP-one-related family protein [Oscillospiraceae bacterium]|nr:LURP-one-related family protein [Oscillospiraceae bacterium]